MSDFWLDPLSTSILHVPEQRMLWLDCTDGRLIDKYHNIKTASVIYLTTTCILPIYYTFVGNRYILYVLAFETSKAK